MTTCSVYDCSNTAQPVTRCGRHLCDHHSEPTYHPCLYIPQQQRTAKSCRENHQLYGLIADIVDAPMTAEALRLRAAQQGAQASPNVTCTVQLPTLPGYQQEYRGQVKWMGYRNLALAVDFSDGVRWLARVRLTDVYSAQVRRQVMLSEYATIQALSTTAPGSVPNVFLPNLDDNSQLIYFFEEFVKGQSLHTIVDTVGVRKVTPAVKKAIEDYADFMINVSKLQFSGVGCLYPSDSKSSSKRVAAASAAAAAGTPSDGSAPSPFVVGPLISDIRSNIPTLGTYRSSQDMHLARVNEYIHLVHISALRPPELAGQPIRLLRYLVALELRDLVAGCTPMAASGPTFIKHMDDAAHNMLGPGDGHIQYIIDWEMAVVVPFAEAFNAPQAFLALDEASLENNRLSQAEEMLASTLVAKGREDLAAAVKGGRRYHYLLRLFDGPAIPGASTDITLGSVWGTRLAFLGDAAGPKPASLNDWYAEALTTYAHEVGFEETVEGLVHWTELNADLANTAADEVESDMEMLSTFLAGRKPDEPSTLVIDRSVRSTLRASKQAKRSAHAARMFAADCRAGAAPAKLAAKKLHDSTRGFKKFVSTITDKLSLPSDNSKHAKALTAALSMSRSGSKQSNSIKSPLSLSRQSSAHSANFGRSLSRTQSRNSSRTGSRATSPTRRKPPRAQEHHLEDLAALLTAAAAHAENAADRADSIGDKGLALVATAPPPSSAASPVATSSPVLGTTLTVPSA